jgi:hypothetical protein
MPGPIGFGNVRNSAKIGSNGCFETTTNTSAATKPLRSPESIDGPVPIGRQNHRGEATTLTLESDTARVVSVSCSATHTMSKPTRDRIWLRRGLGVEGDAHNGETVQHRSRVAKDPSQPNLRQVHLLHDEFFDELRAVGFDIAAGQIGENVTTRGIDLLALPTGTLLHFGETAVVEVTGLRNPCGQLNGIQAGLMAASLDRADDGELIRKAGIMGIVAVDGEIRPGDSIRVERPPGPTNPLEPV